MRCDRSDETRVVFYDSIRILGFYSSISTLYELFDTAQVTHQYRHMYIEELRNSLPLRMPLTCLVLVNGSVGQTPLSVAYINSFAWILLQILPIYLQKIYSTLYSHK